jgi:hypothetical protein
VAEGLEVPRPLRLLLTAGWSLTESIRSLPGWRPEVVALRQPATHYPGLHCFFQGATWLWAGIFLLLTAGLAVLMVTEPTGIFLTSSTAATIVLVVAGTEPVCLPCGSSWCCAGSG